MSNYCCHSNKDHWNNKQQQAQTACFLIVSCTMNIKKEKSIAFYLVVNDSGLNTLIFAGAPPEMTEEQLCHLFLL